MSKRLEIVLFVFHLLIALFAIIIAISYFNNSTLGTFLAIAHLVVAAVQFFLIRSDHLKIRIIGLAASIIAFWVANEIGFRNSV